MGVCLYRAKTFYTECLTHTQKKRAPLRCPPPVLKVRLNLSTIVEIYEVVSIPVQNIAKVQIFCSSANYLLEFRICLNLSAKFLTSERKASIT